MYFSVKNYVKIAGKNYVPCVCYSIPKGLEATVDSLVAKGKAVKHEEKVGFMNGKELVKETKKKHSKKDKTVKVKKEVVEKVVETVAETVAEEKLEESEGF